MLDFCHTLLTGRCKWRYISMKFVAFILHDRGIQICKNLGANFWSLTVQQIEHVFVWLLMGRCKRQCLLHDLWYLLVDVFSYKNVFDGLYKCASKGRLVGCPQYTTLQTKILQHQITLSLTKHYEHHNFNSQHTAALQKQTLHTVGMYISTLWEFFHHNTPKNIPQHHNPPFPPPSSSSLIFLV